MVSGAKSTRVGHNLHSLSSPKYLHLTSGFICCGREYVNASTSLCCLGNDGHPTIHPAGNTTVLLRCCGSKVIRQEQECCNGIGYDTRRHVCADRPTTGLSTEVSVCMTLSVRRNIKSFSLLVSVFFATLCTLVIDTSLTNTPMSVPLQNNAGLFAFL